MKGEPLYPTLFQYAEKCRSVLLERDLWSRFSGGVVVAFSGGADSTFLLSIATEWGKKYGFSVTAIHVNHGIRGSEADSDECFCASFCKERGIDFASFYVDIPALARDNGESIELCARRQRYAILERERERRGFSAIVTAHNATDQAETVLMNLLRGSGAKGLCGIPVARDSIVRPMLTILGDEVRECLKTEGIPYVEDATNQESVYSRNYVRNEILPRLKFLVSSPERAICRAAENLEADESYFSEQVRALATRAVLRNSLSRDQIQNAERPIALRLLCDFCKQFAKEGLYPEKLHLEQAYQLIVSDRAHFFLDLPGGVRLSCDRDQIRITSGEDALESYRLSLHEGENSLPDGSILWIGSMQNKDKCFDRNIYKLSIQVELPSATIDSGWFARSRAAGDSYRYRGHLRKVKKALSDRKIPLNVRDRLPVVCDEEGILWIPFLPPREFDPSEPKVTVSYWQRESLACKYEG